MSIRIFTTSDKIHPCNEFADAYPVSHFSAQRIMTRKQYLWATKICETQMTELEIEPKSFAFWAKTALNH